MIHGVLFDAAGTLIDLNESVGATYASAASAYGVSVSETILQDAFERVLPQFAVSPPDEPTTQAIHAAERDAWRRVVRSTFLAADSTARFSNFDDFFSEIYAFYASGNAWTLRPGVRSCLADLREKGIRIGVLSNFDHRLPGILEKLGIAEFLSCVSIPSNIGARKPEPAAFQRALQALDVAADQALYVGNNPEIDRAGALACSLQVLLVDEIPSLADLPPQLTSLATLERTPTPVPGKTDSR